MRLGPRREPGTGRQRAILLAALALLMPASGPAGAQEWRFDVLSGRYRDAQSAVGASSAAGILGVRYIGASSRFGLTGGMPLTDTDATWGTAVASQRLATHSGPLRFGLQMTGQAFAQSARGDTAALTLPHSEKAQGVPPGRRGPLGGGMEPSLSGWGGSGEITPFVSYSTTSLVVEARAGAAAFRSDFADLVFDRKLGVAYLRISKSLDTSVSVAVEGRSHWAEEGTYPYLGVNALLVRPRFTAWGSVGGWFAEGVETLPWSLGSSLQVADRVSLTGAMRQDAFDPLFQTPGRTSWSIGVSVAFPRRPKGLLAPVPARYEDGVATILLKADQALGAVLVAGDFNDWEAEPMMLQGDEWTCRVHVPPGVYYYSFVSPEGSWFVPESVPGRKPDGFGSFIAVLVVE